MSLPWAKRDDHPRAMAAHLGSGQNLEHCPAGYVLGPWAPLLVDAADLAPDERVLDVACGTGVVTRIAAKRVGPTAG